MRDRKRRGSTRDIGGENAESYELNDPDLLRLCGQPELCHAVAWSAALTRWWSRVRQDTPCVDPPFGVKSPGVLGHWYLF